MVYAAAPDDGAEADRSGGLLELEVAVGEVDSSMSYW